MKPFYGIDRTENRKNTFREGDCFIAASTSRAVSSAMERAAEGAAVQLRKSKLPFPLGGIRTVCGWAAALLLFSIIRALRNVTLLEGYENAPFLFWLTGICGAVWLVLTVIGAVIRKNVQATEDFTVAVKRVEDQVDAAFRELGVPQDAKDVDVIAISHRWKNGKLKPAAYGLETSERTTEPFKVFLREDRLCFATPEHRYEFRLSELQVLRSVKKHIYSKGWNKEEDYDEGFYKPYKLTVDNYGRIHMRSYGLLELEHEGIRWAIWLPPYELNYISALMGLKIVEE